jgi:hypothetical protein
MPLADPLPDPPLPDAPVAPVTPCGIPKFSTADCEVPLLVTVAELPAASVVTVPTLTVAAAPVGPAPPAAASTDHDVELTSGSALLFAAIAMYVEPEYVTASLMA